MLLFCEYEFEMLPCLQCYDSECLHSVSNYNGTCREWPPQETGQNQQPALPKGGFTRLSRLQFSHYCNGFCLKPKQIFQILFCYIHPNALRHIYDGNILSLNIACSTLVKKKILRSQVSHLCPKQLQNIRSRMSFPGQTSIQVHS